MGRKRKRAKAPAATMPEAERQPAAASATAAGTADPSSSTPPQVTLELETAAAIHGAKAVDPAEQSPEDDEGSSDEDSSDGMPGIPWALPPEESDQTDDEDEEQEEEDEDEDEEEDEEDKEEDGEESSSRDTADGGGSSSLPATRPDPENRWKQHPDRRRKLAGGGGGGGRSNSSSNGAGRFGRKSGGRDNVNTRGRGGRGGGARGGRGAGKAPAGAGLDEAADDDCPVAADGHYGPPPPPCTVFAPREGKIHRVTAASPPSTHARARMAPTRARASTPTALVVGLEPLEQLCFVGAARVRCGRGQADLSGYTLIPTAWGPYVEAHSPPWMGLLVVRALDAGEYSEAVAGGGGGGGSSEGDVAGAADDDAAEIEIEEAIDRIAENFPVVVVLKSLSGRRPLKFLSAEADADALYAKADGAGCFSTAAADSNQEGPAFHPLQLAAELRLPGMQVVVTDEPGLRPFTVAEGWAEAANAVLAAPPPTTGGDSGSGGGGGGDGGGGGAVLVCGAKGVGKSTLCRFLVNRMLSRHREVAYMDCDLGQPEFTAPGQVSLHLLQTPVVGPPHANIRRPQLAYFVGTTSSKPEPLLYSAAVRALAERASTGVTAGGGHQQQEEEEQRLSASFFAAPAPPRAPLVVNTDGWVKGMGEDLLGAIIDAVRPRHIVQIVGNSSAKKFEVDLSRLPEGCEVHRVKPWSVPTAAVGGLPIPPRPSAQDQRDLRLVAYFLGQGGSGSGLLRGSASGGKDHGITGDQLKGASLRGGKVYDLQHEVAVLLAAARPRRVPWRAVQIRVMSGSVLPSFVLHAINGALVGLVAMPRQPCDGGGGGGGGDAEPPVGEGLVCLGETPLAPCVGLGIVRSVDAEKRLLYVLTPEPSDVLKDVTVLVAGSLQLPMVMAYDPNWCSHPYFSAEVVVGGVIKNKSHFLRK